MIFKGHLSYWKPPQCRYVQHHHSTIVHAVVVSKVDYCNSVFAGTSIGRKFVSEAFAPLMQLSENQ